MSATLTEEVEALRTACRRLSRAVCDTFADGSSLYGYGRPPILEETPMDVFTKDTPCRTRDGRKVCLLCDDRPDSMYPLVGYVGDQATVHTWTRKGRSYAGAPQLSATDLVRVDKWPTPAPDVNVAFPVDTPLQTRAGDEVRLWRNDLPGAYPLVGIRGGVHMFWTAEGTARPQTCGGACNDLVPLEADPKQRFYVLASIDTEDEFVRYYVDDGQRHVVRVDHRPCFTNEEQAEAVVCILNGAHRAAGTWCADGQAYTTLMLGLGAEVVEAFRNGWE